MACRARLAIVLTLSAVLIAGCGGGGDGGDGGATKVNQSTAGKRLFAEQGCGGCHTFRAAGSTGTQGPSLDDAKPSVSKVVQQVKSGGGMMPSFAGKLSDEEIRQIAAFVGVPDSAASASVVKPFKPDGTRLADCAQKGNECLEQAFGNMTFNDGPKAALATLTEKSASDPAIAANCHRIVHRMGSAALTRFKDRVAPAFVAGSPVCASGYYHGIVERAFLGKPTSQLAAVSRKLCDDAEINRTPFLSYQCLHGLGHGLMIYTGYEMPRSLKTCDDLQTTFAQTSCTGGVFMENFNSSYGVRSKYLRAKDPIYPCNAVAERHKPFCYQLVTANLLRVTGYDQAKTAAGCRKSERDWVKTCFESLGRDVSGIAGKDAKKALASCELAGSNESDCIYGVAREIVNSDSAGDRGGRFCAQAPKATRSHCYSGVGSVLAAIYPNAAQLRAACRKASGSRYAAACRSGGGLPS